MENLALVAVLKTCKNLKDYLFHIFICEYPIRLENFLYVERKIVKDKIELIFTLPLQDHVPKLDYIGMIKMLQQYDLS